MRYYWLDNKEILLMERDLRTAFVIKVRPCISDHPERTAHPGVKLGRSATADGVE